jgi:hypothetical protein
MMLIVDVGFVDERRGLSRLSIFDREDVAFHSTGRSSWDVNILKGESNITLDQPFKQSNSLLTLICPSSTPWTINVPSPRQFPTFPLATNPTVSQYFGLYFANFQQISVA